RRVRAEFARSVAEVAVLVRAGDLVAGDYDAGDVTDFDFLKELGKRNGRRVRSQPRRKLPDQDPHDHEDHPEQQALEGRIQPRPPNRLALKSITPREGSVTRKSSATDCPTTHTILSSPSATSGRESLVSRGILRSTRKSCSFFRPDCPSGRN